MSYWRSASAARIDTLIPAFFACKTTDPLIRGVFSVFPDKRAKGLTTGKSKGTRSSAVIADSEGLITTSNQPRRGSVKATQEVDYPTARIEPQTYFRIRRRPTGTNERFPRLRVVCPTNLIVSYCAGR